MSELVNANAVKAGLAKQTFCAIGSQHKDFILSADEL